MIFFKKKIDNLFFEKNKMVSMVRNLDTITYSEFPKFISELYNLLGYKIEIRDGFNDNYIDIIARKFFRKLAIQVKAYHLDYSKPRPVNKREITSFAHHAQLNKCKPVFITTGVYTNQAILEAKNIGVEIYDRKSIFDLIAKADISLLASAEYLNSIDKYKLKKCPNCEVGYLVKVYSENKKVYYNICIDCKTQSRIEGLSNR